MKVTSDELIGLASLVKAAQIPPQLAMHKKHKTDPLAGSFPDYGRSLAVQFEEHPRLAGAKRALTTGMLSSILGGLIGRMISDKPAVVAGSALAGGALGAIPGYVSGKREAESDKSRLMFLRRLGITRPGELEILMQHPELVERVTKKNTVI